jgi:Fur family ferric uptake transcriptional regulator
MSCTTETPEILRAAGLRSTSARNAVVAALRHSGGHRTVEEISEWIEREVPALGTITPSTVYRTLETLEGVGLVGSVRLPSSTATFEWVGGAEAHSHLVCDRCGAEQMLPAELLEPLEASIESRTGFHPTLTHLALRGECEQCRRARD